MLLNDCKFRQQYPAFIYKDYRIEKTDDGIRLTFFFEIPELCAFAPTTTIKTDNLTLVNAFDSPAAKRLVFSLGLTECVSYFKAVCPATLTVLCGTLSETETAFWKKLYFHGLGEFLYRNDLETDEAGLIDIVCTGAPLPANEQPFARGIDALVPVGGGKDSAVTAALLNKTDKRALYFTVNDQQARTDTVLATGKTERDIVRTYRVIDKNLLALNKQGFLNGHTPFSAIVAFLSAYCAYITGAGNIVLSNEASANESNIEGLSVNHQYSKSYEFEQDFSAYLRQLTGAEIRYFSLLRPFNELQIAKQFADLPRYHRIFRSCNVGSKQNVWCGHCPKCLFVYSILSPFIEKEGLDQIFGGCMLDKKELLEDFKGLCGMSTVKPFECVGTVAEIRCAVSMTIKQYGREGIRLPYLLEYFMDNNEPADDPRFFEAYNREHGVPMDFMPCVEAMYDFVSEEE
ncbi:MAG: hypothetical protein IJ766_03185 [Clostridia bacterium]|nr:hypothetical protein [Clostridia bacterium]